MQISSRSTLSCLESIPVVVGVSGHRDLVDIDLPAVRHKVAESLEKIEYLTPNSPRLLLSALAEGADQLVAYAALERGWSVIALLPMTRDTFVEDFETAEELQRFHDLLRQCIAVREIPLATQLDPDITNLRDQQYRDQGTYLARQAQVVIALWDGQPSTPGAVGTSWVVDVCRKGPPPVDGAVLAAPETTGLIHVPVRRRKAPDELPVAPGVVSTDIGHEIVLSEIDTLNRFARQSQNTMSEKLAQGMSYVIPFALQESLDAGSRWILARYGEADVLAQKYQEQRRKVIIAASVITLVAALCQASYAVMASQPLIIAYGVAIVLAYGLYYLLFRLPRFRIEERFLEYRALAEAARVQLFWRLAGLQTAVAEHYLQYVKSDVGWVREAIRNLDFQAALITPHTVTQRSLVRDQWLWDQEKYFVGKESPLIKGNTLKRRRSQALADRWVTLAVVAGGIMVVLAGLGHLLTELSFLAEMGSAYSATFFLSAGVVKGFATTMGYEEEAASFEKAGCVFRNARDFVDAYPDDTVKFQACILELGKYALTENADWLLQHRRNAFKIEN